MRKKNTGEYNYENGRIFSSFLFMYNYIIKKFPIYGKNIDLFTMEFFSNFFSKTIINKYYEMPQKEKQMNQIS